MKLVTKEIKNKMPPIGANASKEAADLVFHMKLFTPWSNWTWYVAEANWETGECFGLVEGFERELGYFNLKELEEIRGPLGLKIERDMYFRPTGYPELTREAYR